ncbi:MAG: hypothetical protein PVF91_00925 [Chromatiales bacterium]|jgi:DNA repair exonuclease SbcCD ATPase subunit
MTLSHASRSALAGAAIALVGALPFQVAAAEPGHGELKPTQEEIQAYKEAQQTLAELQERVARIRDSVLEDNPGLRQQGQEFKELVASKIDDRGFDLEDAAEKLKSIRQKLQDEALPEDEKQQLFSEFEQIQRDLIEVRNEVLQDTTVQKARTQLQEDLVTAMREEEPDLDELMSQMEQAREEMMQIVRSARR